MTELPPNQQPTEQPYGWENVAQDMQGWHPDLQAHAKRHLEIQGIVAPDEPSDKSIVIHGAEDFSVSAGAEAIPVQDRVAVTKEDLTPPEKFEVGDALIAFVANVKDIRDPTDGEIGGLYPEQADDFRGRIETFMDQLYAGVPEAEQQQVDVVVLAGDTKLVTPGENGLSSESQRAVATGKEAMAGIKASMGKRGIDETHLVTAGDDPVSISHLRDVSMLHENNNPNVDKFMQHMLEKYGAGREFWMAYEEDAEKELRETLGVEGPGEIAQRMEHLADICATIAELHQVDDPNRRVVVFAIGHYDNISPWVKKHLMGINPAEGFVPVEKGAGLVIQKSANGDSKTILGGKSYDVSLDSIPPNN